MKFENIDSNGDHSLSLAEFIKGAHSLGISTRGGQPISTDAAASYFKAMDSDRSGTVSFDEFAIWAAHHHIGVPPTTGRRRGETETPERERELRAEIEMLATSATAIYSPWKARAIGKYPSDADERQRLRLHPSDLQFDVGDIISITSKHCKDWWTGSAHGRHGTFPRTLVKLLPPGSRDAEVQAMEADEARTRDRAPPPRGEPKVSTSGGGRHRGRAGGKAVGVGGARTPHTRPPLVQPNPDELARIFRLWDPTGTGEIPKDKLVRLVQTLWPQFEHRQALERATRALRVDEIGDGSVHSFGDLRLFLRAVAFCEEHWDKLAGLDRVDERRMDTTEFSHATRTMRVTSRAGKEMSDEQVKRAFADVLGVGMGMGGMQGKYVSFEEVCCWMTRMSCGGAITSQRHGAGKLGTLPGAKAGNR